MSQQSGTRNRQKRPLIEGTKMRCPRCKRLHDVLAYVPLLMVEEFSEETTPVYKCPACLWVFAPIERITLTLEAPRLEAQTA